MLISKKLQFEIVKNELLEIKKAEEQVQKKTDVFVKQVDEIVDAKEKEIMSIQFEAKCLIM